MTMKRIAIAALTVLMAVQVTHAQSRPLNRVMHTKLVYTQQILEAVVTSDWVALETSSRELERLTTDPRWTVLQYPEYGKHSAAFVRAIQTLHRAAGQRDLEETPKAYIAVTMACVECHRYLARERIAH